MPNQQAVISSTSGGEESKPIEQWTDDEVRAGLGKYSGNVAGVVLRPFSEIDPRPLQWLWRGVFPLGKLSLIAGDPGLGKSLLTIDFAARVSTGSPWPDGSDNSQGSAIILSAEDDAEDTIRPRLDAAGANVYNVFYLEAIKEQIRKGVERNRQFNLERDLRRLDETIKATKYVRLVIIDPISAYLGDADSHVNAQVRSLLAPLSELASARHIAVIAVNHLNKSGGPAIYRTMGSLAFTAAARSVWAVGREKTDQEGDEAAQSTEKLMFLPVKNNLAPNSGGFRYKVDSLDNQVPRIVWDPERIKADIDSILTSQPNVLGGESNADALEWLGVLLKNGPLATRDLKAVFDRDKPGFSWRTLRRAKDKLGVKCHNKGEFGGPWFWELPGSKLAKVGQDGHTHTMANYGGNGQLWGENKEDLAESGSLDLLTRRDEEEGRI